MGSCFARAAYSSMVREKEVREAERVPVRAGVEDVLEIEVRSLRMALDCRRAELKRVFLVMSVQRVGFGVRANYHDCFAQRQQREFQGI